MKSEAVLEVSDYYDGPRAGIALFKGQPCRFKSRYLDVTEYQGEFESVDLFEILPVNASNGCKATLAKAKFAAVPGQESTPPGTMRKLEVIWEVVE